MLRKSTRPKGNFELVSWFFMRVSGGLLVIFALVHIIFVHYVHGVEQINFKLVANRWATPTWRTFDIVLLTLALMHGSNGVRILVDDYIQNKGWRTIAISGLYTLAFFLIVLGALVILTFQA